MSKERPDTIGGRTAEQWQEWSLHMRRATYRFVREDSDDLAEVFAAAFALPTVVRALEGLRSACEEQYKAGRIAAEPFVRAGNVLAEATR